MINYYLLTKPGIILGNLITFAAGFFLASKGHPKIEIFLAALLGLSFVMASGCIFNNCIDKELDAKMDRTKDRLHYVSEKKALFLAVVLAIAGNFTLYFYTNLLAALLANFGFFVYVILYSAWKSKTIYATAIGSVAGAMPPIVGYVAVSNQLDLGAFIFFALLVLWQMPHFFSIAILHFEDYRKASLPVLPIVKGLFRAKVHMTIYIIIFMLTTLLLTYFNYTGILFGIFTLVVSLIWLALCFLGFKSKQEQTWGRQMFIMSLIVIGMLSIAIPVNFI